MTCKDCIHYEVCGSLGMEVYRWGRKPTLQIFLDKFKAEHCTRFKPSFRFVELPPCKEGDSVYSICFCYGEGDTITEWTVVDIFLLSSKEEGNSVGIRLKDECIFISISPCELGNRYFLTKEEAEQALKLKERENNA